MWENIGAAEKGLKWNENGESLAAPRVQKGVAMSIGRFPAISERSRAAESVDPPWVPHF